MPICLHRRSGPRRAVRRGLTLTELLAASVIMSLIAGALGTLALTVQGSSSYCRGQTAAAQHARVAIQRIQDAVAGATASPEFPGCVAFSETVSGYEFPDTLVVWRPLTAATNPTGRPLVRELVIFCPDPSDPRSLVELRQASSGATVPTLSNASGWRSQIAAIKANATDRIELTDRLRTALATTGGDSTGLRGVVRFHVILSPSSQQWAEYKAGDRTWQNIDWPLDAYGSRVGLRTIVCQCELQLLTMDSEAPSTSLPFFGSASIITGLPR